MIETPAVLVDLLADSITLTTEEKPRVATVATDKCSRTSAHIVQNFPEKV